MPLVACRACEHQVDTSALACPNCGATDPSRPISRQLRNARILVLQIVLGLSLLGFGGWYAWNNIVPLIKQQLIRPAG